MKNFDDKYEKICSNVLKYKLFKNQIFDFIRWQKICLIFQLKTNDKRIKISRIFWKSLKSLKQTQNQLLNTRDLFRVKEINVVLTSLHNFEIILIIMRNCQILMFETRTISRAHLINFFIIYYQHYNNLYNIIENFELTISWNEFFKRISYKMRIAIVWVFEWIFE